MEYWASPDDEQDLEVEEAPDEYIHPNCDKKRNHEGFQNNTAKEMEYWASPVDEQPLEPRKRKHGASIKDDKTSNSIVIVSDDEDPQKYCPCGAGNCLLLTSNTARNPNRRFFTCPSNEKCKFFEWVDPLPINKSLDPSSTEVQRQASVPPTRGGEPIGQCRRIFNNNPVDTKAVSDKFENDPDNPQKGCPCGAGKCLLLTSNTARNPNRRFFTCPSSEKCKFFEWVDPLPIVNSLDPSSTEVQGQVYTEKVEQGTCLKCGRSGHSSRDCLGGPSQQRGNARSSVDGERTQASGTCFKCGEPGHWSRDCPTKFSSGSQGVRGGSGGSSGTCYKCGDSGHWSRNCPT